MSAVAAPRSTTARARATRRAPARVGVTSVLLIVACAAVLIGIVTLQVAVLRLNSERGDLQSKRDQIISAIAQAKIAAQRTRCPMPARIPDQYPVIPGEGFDLLIKHAVIHRRAVQESQQRRIFTSTQPIMNRAAGSLDDMFNQCFFCV